MLDAVLVNEPHGDPAVLVNLANRPESYLLDCGSLHPLRIRDLQRIRRVFVTHTHIDHFIGFDHLVRMQLFCPHELEVYGPDGLTDQVAGKLRGYAWNLVDKSSFVILTHELTETSLRTTRFPCCRQFEPESTVETVLPDTLALPEGPRLSWCRVDHGVACLAFCLRAPSEQKVRKDALAAFGHRPGPWLAELKKGPGPDLVIDDQTYSRQELTQRLLEEVTGYSLGYVSDTIFNKQTAKKMIALFEGCDELWSEAAYLNDQLEKAREHRHMTARQAGRLADSAKVGKLHLFHQSRRYDAGQQPHLEEATGVFANTLPASRYDAGSRP